MCVPEYTVTHKTLDFSHLDANKIPCLLRDSEFILNCRFGRPEKQGSAAEITMDSHIPDGVMLEKASEFSCKAWCQQALPTPVQDWIDT
jgi:hypothetical protein